MRSLLRIIKPAGVVAAGALLATACGAADAPDFVYALNAQGDLHRYLIVEYGADGAPRDPEPLAHPDTAGAIHLAWPSYILDHGERRLLVFMFRDGRWGALGLWREGADGMLGFEGVVFEAGEDEPHGIGPGHVGYLPGVDEPYHLYYLIRGPVGPGLEVRLATSPDGRTWTRHGTVYTAQAPNEAFGLGPSHVCRTPKGEWLLLYQGFPDAAHEYGVAMAAVADDPRGPFRNPLVLADRDASDVMALEPVAAGDATLTLQGTALLQPGPYVLTGADGLPEPVQVTEVRSGGELVLSEPVRAGYSQPRLASALRRKVDVSQIGPTDEGGWIGYFTAFGQFDGVTSEYVYRMTAPDWRGPWALSSEGPQPWFSPHTAEGRLSTENPDRLSADMECRY
jgi:hypothetical protein